MLFIGLGSIGIRHVKNLRKAAKERGLQLSINAVRSSENQVDKKIKDYIVQFRPGDNLDD